MTTVIVQTSQIDFLLKCIKETEIGPAQSSITVLLEFPIGFIPDIDAMREFFEEPFSVHINSGPVGEIYYSAKGRIKDPVMSDIFITHIMNKW